MNGVSKTQTGLGNNDATHKPCFRRRVGDAVGDAPLDVHLEVLKTRQALCDVPRGEAPPGVAREHDRVHALQHRERVGLEECVELELDAPRGAPDGEVHIRDELVEVDVGSHVVEDFPQYVVVQGRLLHPTAESEHSRPSDTVEGMAQAHLLTTLCLRWRDMAERLNDSGTESQASTPRAPSMNSYLRHICPHATST